MGHAAYARGSAEISRQIVSQQRTVRQDYLTKLLAESDRERTRANAAEAKALELEKTLVAARRSVAILRGTLAVERESRRIERDETKAKLEMAARILKTRSKEK